MVHGTLKMSGSCNNSLTVYGLLLVCCCVCVAQEEEENRVDPYTVDGPAARIESTIANETCGTVEGRVQVCEDSFWRNLCDRNVTVQDATVVCRSLNYSMRSEFKFIGRTAQYSMCFHPFLGASIQIVDQLAVQSSSYEAVCSGQEENLAQCPQVDSMISGERDKCVTGSVFVKCFITDERAELNSDCQPPKTDLPVTALPTTTTATASRSTVVTITAAGSSPPLTDTEPGMTSTATQPTLPSVTDTSAPTLYYIIGGLSAIIILTGTFLTMVFLIICCYCRKITEEVKSEDIGQLPLEPLYESISFLALQRKLHPQLAGYLLARQQAGREGGGGVTTVQRLLR